MVKLLMGIDKIENQLFKPKMHLFGVTEPQFKVKNWAAPATVRIVFPNKPKGEII